MGRYHAHPDGRRERRQKPKWTQAAIREKRAKAKFGQMSEAKGMFKAGWRPRQVADDLKIPYTTAVRWRRKLIVKESPDRKKGSGRKRKTTERQDRLIVKFGTGPTFPGPKPLQTRCIVSRGCSCVLALFASECIEGILEKSCKEKAFCEIIKQKEESCVGEAAFGLEC